MSIGPGIRRLLKLPSSLRSIEREIDDEVSFHVESRVESLVSSGLSPASARAQALAEFGDVRGARSDLARIDRQGVGRRKWRGIWDALVQDATYAVRGIRRSPSFALMVVATLSVGIGVNAAMFSVLDRLLLRPAPHVLHAETLRAMYYRVTFPVMGTFTSDSRGYPDYTDLLQQSTHIAGAAAYRPASVTVGNGTDGTRVQAILATASFFPLLGVHPHIGRFFSAEEDALPSGMPVVVLSYGYWQRAFAGDRSVIGQPTSLEGMPYTIIGVTPQGFRGVGVEPVDIFVPMSTLAARSTSPDWATTRAWQWLRILVQLKPGATDAAAAAEATQIFRRGHPDNDGERDATAILASIIPGRAPTGEQDAPLAILLMSVSVLVLVIATANVANLLVTRALRRRREIAVRVALGVSRLRLYAQLVTESVVMALASGACSLAVAWAGGTLLRHWLIPTFAPDDPVVDMRVFALAAMVALGCGIVGGLAPAFTVNRRGFADVVRAGMREGSYRRSRLRSTLVAAQAALTVVLVAGAAMFVASLRNVVNQDMGYDTRHVLLTSLDLRDAPEARRLSLVQEARDRLAALPGVENASVAVSAPFMSSYGSRLRIEGYDSLPRLKDGGPYINAVGHEYFVTMGMRMVRGRGFQPSDVKGSPPVAVVNETMARFYFGGREPLGRCLYLGDSLPPCVSIVGIVHDTHRESVQNVESAQYFVLDRQQLWNPNTERVIMIRAKGNSQDVVPSVTATVRGLGLDGRQYYTQTLQELIEPQLRTWRLGASLLVAFGLVALVVAGVGLYSVVAFDTTQRTQEVGVRIALGARTTSILGLVISDGLRSAALGVFVGLTVTIVVGGLIQNLLFNVSPRDPILLAGAVVVLFMTSVIACVLPARRAARIEPSLALRAD